MSKGNGQRRTAAEKNSGRTARGRPFAPGQSGNPSGRPRGASNKVARPAREWLAGELERRRAALLAAIDADPELLWRCWEWCFGRAPQAIHLSEQGPGPLLDAERLELEQRIGAALGGLLDAGKITDDDVMNFIRALRPPALALEEEP